MSARRTKESGVAKANAKDVAKLRADLGDMKAQCRLADSASVDTLGASPATSAEFDNLTPVERSVASLGVNPDSWKPIAFLNTKHYEQLINQNMLDDDLARRIEAYKVVAGADTKA